MSQKNLFIENRSELKTPGSISKQSLEFERAWVDKVFSETWDGDTPQNLRELRKNMENLIEVDRSDDPESARFVSEEMSHEQFKVLVQEFAMDGLTEAQIFWPIMPRLSLDAQMPMLRMMIDEFGSGNIARSHTKLYLNLLDELEMPKDLGHYVAVNGEDSFAFVNMYYWMILRSETPSYFMGALTYFETMIPFFFECYADICKRLNIREHWYYTEHIHIDEYHAMEGHRILKAMDKDGLLDPTKAWKGALFGRQMTLNAFDAAVDKSRKLEAS